jgi:hypothetical protein
MFIIQLRYLMRISFVAEKKTNYDFDRGLEQQEIESAAEFMNTPSALQQ